MYSIDKTDLEKIRKEFSKLVHNVNWQIRRGTMPYDWGTYGGKEIANLCDLLKVSDSDAHIKKKDKRGYWR